MEAKKLDKILKELRENIESPNDLLANEKPSFIFYLLANKLGYLLDNNPEKTLSNRGIRNRRKINIIIKTPTMMIGYYGKQEETEGILKKHADGTVWIHTGDVGFVDEDGFINVCGRVKRLIIRYDGFKVFPTHIENVVLQHDFVENCCVVGMEDQQHMQGKLPVVFVVCNQRFDNDREPLISEIKTLCGEQLPEYAQPVDIHFVEKLPLTSIGKIDYRALEEMAN